jgi:hypothetical protein
LLDCFALAVFISVSTYELLRFGHCGGTATGSANRAGTLARDAFLLPLRGKIADPDSSSSFTLSISDPVTRAEEAGSIDRGSTHGEPLQAGRQ